MACGMFHRGGTMGVATIAIAMTIALLGVLWSLLALATAIFCTRFFLHKPQYLTTWIFTL